MVAEAINNIAQHARAGQVWVSAVQGTSGVETIVRDDGAGFAPGATESQADHYGLVGIRERAPGRQPALPYPVVMGPYGLRGYGCRSPLGHDRGNHSATQIVCSTITTMKIRVDNPNFHGKIELCLLDHTIYTV